MVPALQAIQERASTQPGMGSKLGAEDGGFGDLRSPIPKAPVSGCKRILEAQRPWFPKSRKPGFPRR